MKKILPFIFVVFFFSQAKPVNAADNLIDMILGFFSGISTYASKDSLITDNSKESFTTYTNDKNDITTRSIDDKSRRVNIGQHIEDIILNKYNQNADPEIIDSRDDSILTQEGCSDVRISEVANFYKTNGKSTSYKIQNNQLVSVPYSNTIKEKLEKTYGEDRKYTLSEAKCFEKYLSVIPVAPKSNETSQARTNTGISEQLNNVEMTHLPNKEGQVEVPPLTFTEELINFLNGGNTQKLKENLYREKQFLSGMIPDKQLSTISDDTSNNGYRSSFNQYMNPDKWQTEENTDGEDNETQYGDVYNGNPASITIGNLNLYIFEPDTGGRKIQHIYDIGLKDASKLKAVPVAYRASGASNVQLDERVIPAYIAMVNAARESGFKAQELNLISGYRSMAAQQAIWDKTPESRRGTWVARPGRSPHHTGRAIDIVVNGGSASSGGVDKQKQSATYKWLQNNAHKFGFYNYLLEPWHWEYNPKAQ